ncbi:multicopper oxidase domain-containing protein [Nonomuraea pusilla]|uniref:Copper-containing nitrite reductase n=1 Tax=Nonomuraea pusilla TaxID=46177 RepID=A0A1H7TR94_9ACTN|nr:multicopper oxidase domain-containing protein [Nonomuraea pusilla]SEL87095.1 nitrite reductase (NO-forming) [Nonomuraea pusilla]
MPPVEVKIGQKGTAEPPRQFRASWHLRANAVVVAWLALSAVVVLAQPQLPAPRWLVVHVFLLGAVSSAILIWSEHFAAALLRVPTPDQRWSMARLGGLNAGAVAVLAGLAVGPWQAAAAGAAAVVAVVVWHAVALARMVRRALPGRFGHVIGWYAAAAGALAVGGTLGGLMAADVWHGAGHERLHAAHAQVNLLGWVALTVLGTLFTLWPTVLRTRMSDRTRRCSRLALRLTVPGLAVAVTGLLLGQRWVAVAGLAGYAAGVAVAVVPLADAARRRRPHTGAAWTVAAGAAWFAVVLAADVARVASGPAAEPSTALDPLLPLLLAGFAGQVLLGSLMHLLPAVLGGGPVRFKEHAALLERGWPYRLAAANLGVPLLALPVPEPLALLGWALVLGALAAFVVLALAALWRARHPAGGRGAHPGPAAAGAVLGCLLTAAAVAVAMSGTSAPAQVDVRPGARQTVEVTLSGMRIRPAVITAARRTVLTLRVTNADAQRHDLRLATGEQTPLLGRGQTAVLTLAPLGEAVDGWCTVAGHRAAGMTMRIEPSAPAAAAPAGQGHAGHQTAAAPSAQGHAGHQAAATPPASGQGTAPLDVMAPMSPGWKPYDPVLPPAPSGTEHRVEIRAKETDMEVAPGVRQRVWTFGGTVPGPVLRGKVGDVFVVTFVNDGTMGHGIDFHAGALAPDQPMRTIQPGERLTYRFRAERAGAWLYHCSTMPMSQHIANGMYGAVVIDPPGLPAVDREFVLVQGEVYLGQPDDPARAARIRESRPDGWAFNGTAAGYDHAPIKVKTGERARVWVVAAGPGTGTAFHVVGGQFDTVYKEGAYLLRRGHPGGGKDGSGGGKDGPGGSQVLDLAPAQGGFVELVFPEAGHYPFVDHAMPRAEAGAHGVFEVSAP